MHSLAWPVSFSSNRRNIILTVCMSNASGLGRRFQARFQWRSRSKGLDWRRYTAPATIMRGGKSEGDNGKMGMIKDIRHLTTFGAAKSQSAPGADKPRYAAARFCVEIISRVYTGDFGYSRRFRVHVCQYCHKKIAWVFLTHGVRVARVN